MNVTTPAAAKSLLIVDDDSGLLRQLRWAFSEHKVQAAANRHEAIALLRGHPVPVAILDLGLPPDPDGASEGLATLSEIRELAPATKVIIATGNETREHALRAIALGAYDFYQKPIDIEVLRMIVGRAEQMFDLEAENRRLTDAATGSPVDGIIATSPEMLRVLRNIEKLSPTDVAVLLLGESGTGKELLAHAIHKLSPRANGPFVPINCAAIPETLLESELFGHEKGAFTGALRQNIGRIEGAQQGTLFLDEIGDVPLPMQVKLLRFLQDQIVERIGGRRPVQVDVRIVCATNQDLDRMMAEGRFREDLYYRLNEVTVRVPALRDRPADAIVLASFFFAALRRGIWSHRARPGWFRTRCDQGLFVARQCARAREQGKARRGDDRGATGLRCGPRPRGWRGRRQIARYSRRPRARRARGHPAGVDPGRREPVESGQIARDQPAHTVRFDAAAPARRRRVNAGQGRRD